MQEEVKLRREKRTSNGAKMTEALTDSNITKEQYLQYF